MFYIKLSPNHGFYPESVPKPSVEKMRKLYPQSYWSEQRFAADIGRFLQKHKVTHISTAPTTITIKLNSFKYGDNLRKQINQDLREIGC